jgi:hypothetical protein
MPQMFFGSMPRDNGHLSKIDVTEAIYIQTSDPIASKYLRRLIGADELIKNTERFCLWLEDATPNELATSKVLQKRVGDVRAMRLESKAASTRQMANTAHLFGQRAQPKTSYIAVPRVSSENREYVPMGYFGPDVVASDALLTIPGASHSVFALLNSNLFNVWNRAVSGRLESRYRISQEITYNNFPIPTLSKDDELTLGSTGLGILEARLAHPTSSLANLYNPLTMPIDLRKAHEKNNKCALAVYGLKQTATEAEILTRLFELYGEMA